MPENVRFRKFRKIDRKTFFGVSFFNENANLRLALLLKRDTDTDVFRLYEIFRNTFFKEHLLSRLQDFFIAKYLMIKKWSKKYFFISQEKETLPVIN